MSSHIPMEVGYFKHMMFLTSGAYYGKNPNGQGITIYLPYLLVFVGALILAWFFNQSSNNI